MIIRLGALAFVLVCWASARLGAVVVATEVGLPASALYAADLLTQPGYSATGWVDIAEGSARYRGTGVLIADNWVLTAAHNWDAQALTALTFHLGGVSYSAEVSAWFQTPLGQPRRRLAFPKAGTSPCFGFPRW